MFGLAMLLLFCCSALMIYLLWFQLEKAYDTVMMQQLQYRKKGVTYGFVQVRFL